MNTDEVKNLGRAVMWWVILVPAVFTPFAADAFSLGGFIKGLFERAGESAEAHVPEILSSSATESPVSTFVIVPVQNENPKAAAVADAVHYVDGATLLPAGGPMGNAAEVDEFTSYRITTYTVREGDNLSEIAKTFGVSVGTIFWANNLSSARLIRPGDTLVILPVSGAKHTVKSGETIESIAKKYKVDANELRLYNEIAMGGALEAGSEIIVPNVELELPSTAPKSSGATKFVRGGGPDLGGYFMRPLFGGRKTQGLHGYNGVDIAASCGTPLYASAAGSVVIAREGGWNGGYGNYVAIAHPNGTQTVYGHMQSVAVSPGANVEKGQYIGALGTSGRSTGCHVHFEIRGAKNPF